MFYYGNHDIKVLSHSEARAVNEIIELARNLIYDGFLGDWNALHREVLKFIPSLTASQQGMLSSSGVDLEAAIRLALETLKAEQRLITAQALAETTQTIAELCWYYRASLRHLAMHLKISEDEVSAIQESNEYLAAVETLIYTTRSPAEIQDWIQTYPRSEMPKKFGKRMGLAETAVSQLIEKVLENLTETIAPENTPPLRTTTQTTVAPSTTQRRQFQSLLGQSPELTDRLIAIWQTLPLQTQATIWQTLPLEIQYTLLNELSKQIQGVGESQPLSDILQSIETAEILNVENMSYLQIQRAVAEKRIQRYTSLHDAAASLGIDTRTLKSYANWQETDP